MTPSCTRLLAWCSSLRHLQLKLQLVCPFSLEITSSMSLGGRGCKTVEDDAQSIHGNTQAGSGLTWTHPVTTTKLQTWFHDIQQPCYISSILARLHKCKIILFQCGCGVLMHTPACLRWFSLKALWRVLTAKLHCSTVIRWIIDCVPINWLECSCYMKTAHVSKQ